MTNSKLIRFVLASALGLPAFAATSITFQFPGAISTLASKINNNGDIAGTYQDAGNILHVFRRYSDGTFQTFDVPGALSLSVTGLTDQGEIVGLFYTIDNNGATFGYTLSATGVLTTFAPPGSTGLQSASINNSGTIAGAVTLYDPAGFCCTRKGYLRSADGTFTTFDGPQGALLRTVDAINDSGVIAGTLATNVLFQRSTGGRYKLEGVGIDGVVFSSYLYARGINASGVVVGNRDYGISTSATLSEYFTWDGTRVTTFLSRGPGYSGSANGINDAGVVTGFGYISKAVPSSAFIRASDGTITTFSVGLVLTIPASINNSGVICGFGTNTPTTNPNYTGFLYTP